jgi:hypothetical protein
MAPCADRDAATASTATPMSLQALDIPPTLSDSVAAGMITSGG